MPTPQSQDFNKWYNDVVLTTNLAEYSPVRGCMIIKPYGYAIWENIQKILDAEIKKLGAKNVYFPLFIPESFLKREAEHVKGFAPQVAWVTHGGQKRLQEKLAIRPTSETIMYDVFKNWIQSYRDLPLKINQWANIVRWEMRPRLFLRTLEFLWQEGHTAHTAKEGADKMAKQALELYRKFSQDWLAIYCIPGKKTDAEKFAGALYTLSVEALMKDGRALQMGTSHNLGQNFSKSFNIKFLDKDGKQNYVWQTSWGVSTRLIGGLIMAHGDNKGLVLPPKLAPIQLIIIPIPPAGRPGWTNNKEKDKIKRYISKIENALRDKNVRFEIDWRKQTPGWKFNDWELKGVPLRLEVGPKEVKERKITYVFRDDLKKEVISFKQFEGRVKKFLEIFQDRLLEKSRAFTQNNTHKVKSYSEFKEAIEKQGGFIKAQWCGNGECEKQIQEETRATIRCIPLNYSYGGKTGKCVKCGQKSKFEVLFAKAY